MVKNKGLFYDKSVFRVIIFASITIIISISLMGYLVYTIAYQETLQKLKHNDLQFISQSISSKIDARINRAKESSLLLASDPQLIDWIKNGEVNKQSEDDVLSKLNSLVEDYDYTKSFIASGFTHHYWTNEKKIIETLSRDDSYDDWFFDALNSNQKIDVNIDYNKQYEETFVWINTLVQNDGQPIAVVGVGLSLNELSKELESFNYGHSSNLWIIDKAGEIYLSNDLTHNGKSIEEYVPMEIKDILLQDSGNEYKLIEYEIESGEMKDLITQKLQSSEDLKLVYQIPRNETMSFIQTVKANTIFAIIISLISIVFIFYFISKRLANPYKRALELNMELDNIVRERTLELSERNEKITDSINYAKRIQRTVLPSQESMEAICNDHFIIYLPRDGVGGDFYWTTKMGDDYLIAVGDCTGHGVPGALMTMLSVSLLNNIAERNESIYKDNPAAILRKMNSTLKETLKQQGKKGITDDGLDIGLCYVKPGKKMIFSGAKLSLYKRDDNGLSEYNGDRKSVGYRRTPFDYQYTNHKIDISDNAFFYLTTDGFIDQNGEDSEFGFGKKRFKELLNKYYHLNLEEQRQKIEIELNVYMKSEPQRDDITFLGFKLN